MRLVSLTFLDSNLETFTFTKIFKYFLLYIYTYIFFFDKILLFN